MKKEIAEATGFYLDTGQHAFVVDFGDHYEWFGESYFDNGFEGGFVVWGTTWA